jgi:hypothetical protein
MATMEANLLPSGHADSDYDEHTHHHQAPQAGADNDGVRDMQAGYEAGTSGTGYSGANGNLVTHPRKPIEDSPSNLFPDMPAAKKRKFILVEDNARGSRLRVRVTLETVNTREIPDSFRKGSSVFPRSFFPREMQNPPPSPTGTRFFNDLDRSDGEEDDSSHGRSSMVVRVPLGEDGKEMEVTVPRMKASQRSKEVRLNELGYRMSWLQSRVFAGRTLFLQRALDCYRNKTKGAIDNMMADVRVLAPHYETRIGKRRWNERMRRRRGDSRSDD